MERNNDECHAIVIEYLLHYCYEQSARALLKDIKQLDNCNVASEKDYLVYQPTQLEKQKKKTHLLDENEIQWDHITARKTIHHAIQLGDISKALKLIEHTFPNIMTASRIAEGASQRVLYKLQCQQFIEVLRSEGEVNAIQFAQRYLRPHHRYYAELADSVTCLIAYPKEDPHAIRLLSQERRDTMADEVNQMILEFQHSSARTTLERLYRQKITIETELDNQKREEIFKKNDVESREKVSV
ncbi:hypothetical protein K501DRAFT_328445 [Backusella circina FSU 941]|nr:hypothetical protein K501DRAFT_264972 [Backusella circina FSU 941]KAI8890454.1 hypothetical protein K501DRAFT_328445 [Backusella circina FSU 941]